MAEEKVREVEFYFYRDLDDAFLNVVKKVRENESTRRNIFAKVMYITRQNKKDVVVYVTRSDELNEEGSDKYPDDARKRNRQVEKEGLKKVYSLPEDDINEVDYGTIDYGQVYDGDIPVAPLNTFYQGKRDLVNFSDIKKYKNCDTIECIRNKTKCDNNTYFEDNLIKFSKDSDKPHTLMFCRKYGLLELADELNKITQLEAFKTRLQEEYNRNFTVAKEVEEYLLNAGSEQSRDFLKQIRLKLFKLDKKETELINELTNDKMLANYEEFSILMKQFLFSADPEKRKIADNVKIYLKYSGTPQIKDLLNRVDAEVQSEYIAQREKFEKAGKFGEEPSFSQMTFSIGQKLVKSLGEVYELGRRKVRDVKKTYGKTLKYAGDIAESMRQRREKAMQMLSKGSEQASSLYRRLTTSQKSQQPQLMGPRESEEDFEKYY